MLARVRGRSMQPTLAEGDLLLVRRRQVPVPGEVVALRLREGIPVVKRVLRQDQAGWWVERDNPREGVDSWSVGAVPDTDLIGVVRVRLWPRPGRVSRLRRP